MFTKFAFFIICFNTDCGNAVVLNQFWREGDTRVLYRVFKYFHIFARILAIFAYKLYIRMTSVV